MSCKVVWILVKNFDWDFMTYTTWNYDSCSMKVVVNFVTNLLRFRFYKNCFWIRLELIWGRQCIHSKLKIFYPNLLHIFFVYTVLYVKALWTISNTVQDLLTNFATFLKPPCYENSMMLPFVTINFHILGVLNDCLRFLAFFDEMIV